MQVRIVHAESESQAARIAMRPGGPFPKGAHMVAVERYGRTSTDTLETGKQGPQAAR